MKTEITATPAPPASLERKAKATYAKVGVDQVFMGAYKGQVHSFLYGKHREEHLYFGSAPKVKKGGHALNATLSSIRRGIELFGDSFHFRHTLHSGLSSYLTYSIIEEEWACRANKLEAGHLRALLDMNPITVFDMSAKTARLRELCTHESAVIGYERCLKKK